MAESEAIRSARRAIGLQLAELRARADLTQAQLATAIAYSRTTLANVETGRQSAAREFWVLADARVSAEGGLLRSYEALDSLVAERHRNRRSSTAATAPSRPDGSAVDVVAVRAVSEAFRTADRQVGGGKLYPAVLAYLQTELAPRLVNCPNANDLFAATASLTEIVAWMAHDDGQDQVSRQHFGQAYRLATAADKPNLIANICAGMSHLADQLGQHDQAVRFAQTGLDRLTLGEHTYGLAARLHVMRARGLAHRRDATGARAALSHAERALTRAHCNQPGEWVSPFDQGALSAETANVLWSTGDLTAAEAHARQVISLRTGDRVRSRAFGRLALAQIRVAQRRFDEAAALGSVVTTTAQTLTSARVRAQLVGLGRELSLRTAAEPVAEFVARLVDLQHARPTRGTMSPEWPV